MPHIIGYLRRLYLMIVLLVALALFAACGGGQSADTPAAGSADIAPVAPTMPAGQFVAVGEQSGLTKTVALTTTTGTTQTAAAAPDLARGEASYIKNKCGDCHGAAGEGVADKGGAITELSLTLAEFDTLLRTGGGLGNTHIFGRSAVSPSGMESLYAYSQSFE